MSDFENNKEMQTVGSEAKGIDSNNSVKNSENKTALEVTETLNSKVIILVTSDYFCAKIKLTAPKEDDENVFEKDILDALKENGVVRGVKKECISRLLKYPIYDKTFKIAQGLEPIQGKDGKLIFHFNKENNLVPQVLEDGSVDYKNMGFSNEVKEGDLLCEIVEAVKGEDGFDVLGHTIASKMGNSIPPPNGSNTKISEDGTKLYAMCDGHVSIKDNKVNIRRVMVVDQVDKATGNILFSGDVTVNGDVSDGFTIRAGGSITVKGVVENAVLVAGRDIVISKGIKGKDSVVSAGGNIRTGYIETAKVNAKECIYVDAVLNSEIKCEEKMIVTGRRGCLIGGVCRVSKELQVKEIGNDVNVFTEIILISPKVENNDKGILATQINECNEKLDSLKDTLRASTQSTMPAEEKKEAVVQILISKRDTEAKLRALSAQLEELNSDTEIVYAGRILLHGHMYPNVSLNMEGLILKNSVLRPACTITRKEDNIAFGAHIG